MRLDDEQFKKHNLFIHWFKQKIGYRTLYKACGRYAYLSKTFLDTTRQIVVVVRDKNVNKIKVTQFLGGTENPRVPGSIPGLATSKH